VCQAGAVAAAEVMSARFDCVFRCIIRKWASLSELMESKEMSVRKYTDIWGGKNYGCYPKHTPGQTLKEKLDKSDLWHLSDKKHYIDERNDNQCDIHRGSDFTYTSSDGKLIINVYMSRSRSGKTVDWEFRCNFDGLISI
jgi:hypothetical protein